jgi:hypothetical protein
MRTSDRFSIAKRCGWVGLVALLSSGPANTGAEALNSTVGTKASRRVLHSSLPLFFESLPEQGRASTAARFVLRTPDYNLLLAQNGGIFEFPESGQGRCGRRHNYCSGSALQPRRREFQNAYRRSRRPERL